MKVKFRNLVTRGVQNPKGYLNLFLNLPRIIKLIFRLFNDRRTPLYLKFVVVLALLYIISPFDLISDLALPVIGQVDDLIILIFALQFFLKRCPPDLVAEHVEDIENKR